MGEKRDKSTQLALDILHGMDKKFFMEEWYKGRKITIATDAEIAREIDTCLRRFGQHLAEYAVSDYRREVLKMKHHVSRRGRGPKAGHKEPAVGTSSNGSDREDSAKILRALKKMDEKYEQRMQVLEERLDSLQRPRPGAPPLPQSHHLRREVP